MHFENCIRYGVSTSKHWLSKILYVKKIPMALSRLGIERPLVKPKTQAGIREHQVAGNLNRNSVEVCSTPVVFTIKK